MRVTGLATWKWHEGEEATESFKEVMDWNEEDGANAWVNDGAVPRRKRRARIRFVMVGSGDTGGI